MPFPPFPSSHLFVIPASVPSLLFPTSFSFCSYSECPAAGCTHSVRQGVHACLHNVASHGTLPGAETMHEYLDSIAAAEQALREQDCVWSPVSWPTPAKQSQSFQCAHKATLAGLISKVGYDTGVAAQTAAASPRFENNSHLYRERQVGKGLQSGRAPSLHVECGCQSSAFWRLVVDPKDTNCGKFEVGAYVLHGERCTTVPSRCPELFLLAQELLLQNPDITAPQLHDRLDKTHPHLPVSAKAVERALSRARAMQPDARSPAPTSVIREAIFAQSSEECAQGRGRAMLPNAHSPAPTSVSGEPLCLAQPLADYTFRHASHYALFPLPPVHTFVDGGATAAAFAFRHM